MTDASVIEMERILIGSILVERGQRIPPLLPDEFFLDKNRLIWSAIADLGLGVDLTTLYAELEKRQHVEASGGAAYLAQCVEDGVLAVNIPAYAEEIRGSARERLIRRLGQEMTEQGLPSNVIEQRLAEIPGPIASSVRAMGMIWGAVKARWAHDQQILTGLTSLDAVTGGITPGDVLVIGGRTSHGKTSLLAHLAIVLADQGVPVDYVTLEESDQSILRRCIANRAGMHYNRLRSGGLPDYELKAAEEAVAHLGSIPLTITSMTTLRSSGEDQVCGAIAASKAPVVILDHLQRVLTRNPSRVYGLEAVLGRLAETGLRDQKAVIVAAQLGRSMEDEQRPPRLSDLRDCGAIEIIARAVWLVYWPWKHDASKPMHEYRVLVQKQSDGAIGDVTLGYDPTRALFYDPASRAEVPW